MNETAVMSLLVVTLLTVAGVYTWRSIRTLRRTTPYHEMLPDDRQFARRMAWRRLVNSGLMLVLAAMIAFPFVTGWHQRVTDVADRRQQDRLAGKLEPLDPDDRKLGQSYVIYWSVTLLMLGIVLAVAGLDLWATRRYGLRKFRQIQSDRRAMLQRQLERYRQERDGLGQPE